jgi:hypothetical protein
MITQDSWGWRERLQGAVVILVIAGGIVALLW